MTATIADRIKSRLKKLNLSMRKASLEAGLSDAFIRNIVSGKSESPRGINLTKIAKALSTTELWLQSGEGPEDGDGESDNKSLEDVEFMALWRNAEPADRQVILALLRSRRVVKD